MKWFLLASLLNFFLVYFEFPYCLLVVLASHYGSFQIFHRLYILNACLWIMVRIKDRSLLVNCAENHFFICRVNHFLVVKSMKSCCAIFWNYKLWRHSMLNVFIQDHFEVVFKVIGRLLEGRVYLSISSWESSGVSATCTLDKWICVVCWHYRLLLRNVRWPTEGLWVISTSTVWIAISHTYFMTGWDQRP